VIACERDGVGNLVARGGSGSAALTASNTDGTGVPTHSASAMPLGEVRLAEILAMRPPAVDPPAPPPDPSEARAGLRLVAALLGSPRGAPRRGASLTRCGLAPRCRRYCSR